MASLLNRSIALCSRRMSVQHIQSLKRIANRHQKLIIVNTSQQLSEIHSRAETQSQHNTQYVNRLDWFLQKLGYFGLTSLPKAKLNVVAARLFVCCSEYNNFDVLREELGLEDTFSSWLNTLQLHVWMLSARLMNHSTSMHKDMKFLLNRLHANMWVDVEGRSKKIASGSVRKESLGELGEAYQAVYVGYDEGLLTDDKVLASAIWRNLFSKQSVDPEKLYLAVNYVNKNLHHLESLSDSQILTGFVTFIPFHNEKPDSIRDKKVYELVCKV